MASTSPEVLQITRVCLLERRCDRTDAPADTSHVPCKFFRLGTCQAGSTCVFSHSIDTAAEVAPCKYFAKVVRSRNRKASVVTADPSLPRGIANSGTSACSRTSFLMAGESTGRISQPFPINRKQMRPATCCRTWSQHTNRESILEITQGRAC